MNYRTEDEGSGGDAMSTCNQEGLNEDGQRAAVTPEIAPTEMVPPELPTQAVPNWMVQKLTLVVQALAECRDATNAKKIVDAAHAVEVYARRQKLGDEAILYAHGVKADALRLLGQFLIQSGVGPGQPKKNGNDREPFSSNRLPKEVSKKESSIAQFVAKLPQDIFEEFRSNTTPLAEIRSRYIVRPNRDRLPASRKSQQTAWGPSRYIDRLERFKADLEWALVQSDSRYKYIKLSEEVIPCLKKAIANLIKASIALRKGRRLLPNGAVEIDPGWPLFWEKP